MSRLRALALALVALASIAQCGHETGAADAGADGPLVTCTTTEPCPSGEQCFFEISQGCAAVGQCFSGFTGSCKGSAACDCQGKTTFTVCGPPGFASEPIESVGPCTDVVSPDFCQGPACEICDVTGYTPAPMAAPLVEKAACTSSEIASFASACLAASATPQGCQAWQADAGACASCVLTMQTASAWGPLVCSASGCSPNLGGCVDLELGTVADEKTSGGTGSCGDYLEAAAGCEEASCLDCQPSDLAACEQSTALQACKTYVDAASSAAPCAPLATDAAPPGTSRCAPQSDADYAAFLDVFCGAGP